MSTSPTKIRLKRFLRIMFSQDLKTIAIFLLLAVSLFNMYALILGYLGDEVPFNTPSIYQLNRAELREVYGDSDGDILPDIVETTPRGEEIIIDGEVYGVGTGTDPYDMDTDNDGFTDAIEDNLGSDPTNWFNPGYIWVLWIIAIGAVLVSRYMQPDLLREYREFEQLESTGVAGKEGKFAYGTGSSIFSKKDLSAEEKEQLIKQDPRFLKMTGEMEFEKVQKQRNWLKLISQLVIAGALAAFMLLIINN